MIGEEHNCDRERFKACENNLMCGWCEAESLYKNTKEETRAKFAKQKETKKQGRIPGEIPNYVKGRKEGMDLEKRVANRWNQTMNPGKKKKANVIPRLSLELEEQAEEESAATDGIQVPEDYTFRKAPPRPIFGKQTQQEAKRQPNSGAMWYAKGDILLDHALMEVKERGTLNGKGEKTITIPKEWLDKQEKEAFEERRDFWYLAFAYKNSPDIYLIKPFDQEAELIKQVRELTAENERLRMELAEKE